MRLQEKYAKTIKVALKNAADIYKMNGRMEVTIRYPQTPNERIDADQQHKIAAMHREFEAYTRQHGMWF